jgi:hypothetical protein
VVKAGYKQVATKEKGGGAGGSEGQLIAVVQSHHRASGTAACFRFGRFDL